jgi:hypothetical protein
MLCHTCWYHRKVLWGMDGTYSNGNPRHVCVSSHFAIRGGTTWKSCKGWMGPNPKGTHRHVCASPRFAIHGRSALWMCEARVRFIPKGEYPRLDIVHAATWCMDTVSISEWYCMGTLPWRARTKGSFLQVHNNASLDAKWLPCSSRLVIIGRDEKCLATGTNFNFGLTTMWGRFGRLASC